jgi:sensor domain CHASE-containing protein
MQTTTISKKSILIGSFIFTLTITLTQLLAYQIYTIRKNHDQQKAVHEANIIKDRLKTSLSYSLSATKTLAFIVENYGVANKFNEIAKDIISANKYIDALELTNKGVITNVYPAIGNQGAIGYNILADSLRNKEAYKSILKKEIFFAGPLELKQGGIAVVGRLPMFINDNFQGFSIVIIKLSTLLKAAGIDTVNNGEFIYQLSKVNPNTNKEEFFLNSPSSVDKKYFASVEIPYGNWKLYVKLKKEKRPYFTLLISVLGFLLSVIGGLFAWYLTIQPEKLKQLVEEKTHQLIIANKELAIQNEEKEKRTAQLIIANTELKKAEEYQKEYIRSLKEMMFITSHKMRQPVAHILGIATVLDTTKDSKEELMKLIDYMKQSATTLDLHTKELTIFIHELERKEKSKTKDQ